ncbi:conserved hypothetical protein [Ramlibacter tataouinensis TTB310]|uniref:Uncharacterized protein n=1 Tax=Ramlibacter tataouinensis (strain ATCC BAA-407 / DSM 14655 / LMG 21543 / TTB310) TaxID=365046 RepID=F5XVZ3_RAMTT|nr:conserved hypothetical protein [Ramlibacter tataouinensis TTB310]
MELVVSDGAVRCRWRQAGNAARVEPGHAGVDLSAVLEDFKPREFDGIVLCTGSVDAEWPNDLELLSLVFARTRRRWAGQAWQRVPRRLVPLGLAAAVLTAMVTAWPLLLEPAPAPASSSRPTIEEARARVQRALATTAGGRLVASIERRTIHVTGMAEDAREAMASRAALNAHRGPYPAVPRFTVATDIAEAIRGTSGLTNASVRHVGDGVFDVVADVTDERAARAALDRMGADLAPTVKRITARLERIYPSDPLGPVLSRSQQDGLTVVQTRDGVKHLVIQSPRAVAPPPVSVSAAAPRSRPVRSPAQVTATATSPKGLTP